MMHLRKALVSLVAAVAAVLAVGVPAAGASTIPTPAFVPFQGTSLFSGVTPTAGNISSPAGPCGTSSGQEGQSATAGTAAQVCTGSGLTFIGPAIGQVATVIGPTIIGPAVIGNVVVSAGNGNVG
jgi:hypothetical protein